MNAYFKRSNSGAELYQHRLGDLVEGMSVGGFEGESLDAIRAAAGIVAYPPGAARRRAAAAAETHRIAAIKAEAQRRIIAITGGGIYWREKQTNLQARWNELSFHLLDAGSITTDEAAERAAIEALWAKIKAIRAHSNALEADAALAPSWPF